VIIHANNDKFENVARLLIFNPYPYNAQLDIFINEKIFKEINPILGLYEFHILTSIAENILIHENVHSGKMKKPIINRIYSEGDGREPSLTDTFIFEFGDSDMACWWFRPRLVGIDRRK
jgi:hypothetical protein